MTRIYCSKAAPTEPSAKVLQAPPPSMLKVNVDASLVEVGWVGLGVVGRDSMGEVVFATTRHVKAF